ncbi:hypothetical protein NHQ30_000029 [Ciborinia camelliae]|nr:hypothetical protein NHQ30_000029 [Ciborinia camelliae]
MQTVTIEKILKTHLQRTGRNSILMNGGIGLTIDTKIQHIPCLGLGVYAFWEIVKVERWWEFTVRQAEIHERLGVMREMGAGGWKRSGEDREEGEGERLLMGEEKSGQGSGNIFRKESEPESEMRGENDVRGRLRIGEGLGREAIEENEGEMIKRKRVSPEDSTSEMSKRRKKALDDQVEIMRLKNENPPPIDTLDQLAESTNEELQRHDEYVERQRRKMTFTRIRLGMATYLDMSRRFEVSWERQRQDIINRDPLFRYGHERWAGVEGAVVGNELEDTKIGTSSRESELELAQEQEKEQE